MRKHANKKRKSFSLRWKLTNSISAIIGVVVILSVVLSYSFFNKVSHQLTANLNEAANKTDYIEEIAEEVLLENMVQIDQQIHSGFNLFLAQMEQLVGYLTQSENTDFLKNHASLPKNNGSGDDYANYPRWNNATLNHTLIPRLERIVHSYEELQLSYYATPDKGCYISPKLEVNFKDFDCTTRPWYTGAVANKGEVFWTDAYIDGVSNEPVITVSKTIESNGQVMGVAGLDVSLAGLTSIIQQVKIGKTGEAFLVDSKGIILTDSTKSSMIGKNIAEHYAQFQPVFEKESGLLEYEEDGKVKVAHFSTNPYTDWKIIVSIEKEDLFAMHSVLRDIKLDNQDQLVRIEKLGANFVLLIALIGISFTLFGIFAAFVISNRISKRVSTIQQAMSEVSKGDLTKQLKTKEGDEIEELAKNFNAMSEQLKNIVTKNTELVKKMQMASANLASVSEETIAQTTNVAFFVEDIADSSIRQNEDIQEATSIVHTFSDSITQVIKNSERVSQSVNHTSHVIEEGQRAVTELAGTSEKNLHVSQVVSQNIEELNHQINEITAFTASIKGIAQQTNLLSLNASIEAARSGETGRGFQVVANEVKKLAEESSKSANKIEKIIQKIAEQVTVSVQNMNETEKIAQAQHEMVEKTKRSFTAIHENIRTILEKNQEMDRAMVTIDENKDILISTIENISMISEKSAVNAHTANATTQEQLLAIEEITNAIQELNEMTESLTIEIDSFKI